MPKCVSPTSTLLSFLHLVAMLSSSTCSAICSSGSSQTFYDCSSRFSISDLCFDAVSQPPADICMEECSLPRVVLPPVDRRTVLTSVSGPTTEQPTVPKGQEEPQTIRKLVLRKRTTSPYQIRLPSMSDRLRVRNGKLVVHADTTSKPAIPASRSPRPYFNQTRRPAPRTLSHPNGAPNIHVPRPVYPPYFKRPDLDQSANVDGPHEHPFNICISPPHVSGIHAVDTWSEICEDLCRAMEVLSVLSDLDTNPMDPSPSMTFGCSLPPCSVAVSPGLGDHWHSYVFPRLVV
ncbi:hypothetical protein BD309DRAFT_67595 [Dichomitus squalens]|uniref:Uncharacterized protein n=1 Tax=Dichomitus squalens TaxID=114155 RepID=A0A4Q9QD78_9APHY|nr:hypothetical protein BD309DRAFT_67595 [Dichomitus squalens]TBU65156.1 hypothetical protein BD310DRAFT_304130 [Dichomitus squalens]